MTDVEKYELVKKLYGKKDDGTYLTAEEVTPFLIVAGNIITNRMDPYGSVSVVPPKYEVLQCRMTNFLLVKQGAEGEIQHTENGVTCIYGKADIPDDLLREVVPKAGVFRRCED